jgi:hypothetical protein
MCAEHNLRYLAVKGLLIGGAVEVRDRPIHSSGRDWHLGVVVLSLVVKDRVGTQHGSDVPDLELDHPHISSVRDNDVLVQRHWRQKIHEAAIP